jgi:hypothetical protein
MTDDRVQEALAAHLEHGELGGPEPDVSHLTDAERDELRELIALLDQTEGVAFHGDEGRRAAGTSASPAGARVLATLRDVLPPATRVGDDPAAATTGIEGMDVREGWIVGTFGGRVRVWLLDAEGALQTSDRWLRDLERVFRLFPDTVALALVEPDLSSLLVQPEDCAPTIEVPRGSLVGRRYRRPVHPLDEALGVFLRELIPAWEPVEDLSEHADRVIDIAPVASERAEAAISEQVAAGGRARKTNPKRKALSDLGPRHAGGLAKMLVEIHEGRTGPDTVEDALRKLASEP